MTVDPQLLAARARVAAAKLQLDASVAQAKARLSPRSLASDAVESATDKATQVAQSGLQIARERPGAVAAVIGAIGVALARKPLLGWAGSVFGRRMQPPTTTRVRVSKRAVAPTRRI